MADELIESAAERLGYVLKEEQRKVVSSLVSSEDVFGILRLGMVNHCAIQLSRT